MPSNFGHRVFNELEQHRAAIDDAERAFAIRDRPMGGRRVDMIEAVLHLGRAHRLGGNLERAYAVLQPAHRELSSANRTSLRVAVLRFELASAQWALGRDRAGALELARGSRQYLASNLEEPYRETLDEITEWIARRSPPTARSCSDRVSINTGCSRR